MNVICAICGKHIENGEVDPLSISVQSEGCGSDADESQQFYCHAMCLKNVLNKDIPFLWE